MAGKSGRTPIGKLLDGIRRPDHEYKTSSEVFPEVNVARIAETMELRDRGMARGQRNDPPTNSLTLDEVETEIVERIETERKLSLGMVEDEVRTFAERVSALDFDHRIATVRQDAAACVSEFKAASAGGLDEIHPLRRKLVDAERERNAFREKNGIDRVARVSNGASTALKISVLVLVFLVETVANGSFLAQGNEQGLLGGTTEAAAFAFLNLGSAFLFGFFGVVWLAHRSLVLKLVGLTSLAGYLVAASVIALALAHYRDASASLNEAGGIEVMRRLAETPFQLDDIRSWVFFAISFLFSVIAFIDGYYLSDPYPGYAGAQKRLDEAQQIYFRRKSDLIGELQDIRDDYRDALNDASKDLSTRQGEHNQVQAYRQRLLNLHAYHQNHLDRACGSLLGIYREANAAARTSPPPAHFRDEVRQTRPAVIDRIPGSWDEEELKTAVRETQAALAAEVQSIFDEFERTMEKYRQIDDLVPEHAA